VYHEASSNKSGGPITAQMGLTRARLQTVAGDSVVPQLVAIRARICAFDTSARGLPSVCQFARAFRSPAILYSLCQERR